MKNTFKSSFVFIGTLLSVAMFPGCLKTRSQLRQNESASAQNSAEEDVSAKPSHYQNEEIKAELVRLNGAVEEMQQKLATQSATKETTDRLEMRIAELERTQAAMNQQWQTFRQAQAEAERQSAEERSVKENPEQALKQAMALLKDGQLAEAGKKLEILANSKTLKNKDRAEAQFGLGQSQFEQGEYRKAIVTLSKVQEVYGKSPRVPTSLFYIAQAFDKLNLHSDAVGFYNELVEKFPSSAEAKQVKKKGKKQKT
jgi:TolA-binding protein